MEQPNSQQPGQSEPALPIADFPACMNVKQLYDYLGTHIDSGRAGYLVEFREHYPALPPRGDQFDEREQKVFIRAVY